MEKTTRKTSNKARKPAKNEMQMATAAHVEVGGLDDAAILNAMLNGDTLPEIGGGASNISDEIIEPAAPATNDDPHAIEAAVAEIEKAEATQALYADADNEGEGDAKPTGQPPATEDKPAKAKKVKAPKEPKPPRLTYVTNKKSEVLASRLGDKAGEFLVLEVNDAMLDEDALKDKMGEVMASIDACGQKKVQEKAVMLFSWMKTGGKLNEVMARAFRVLVNDGEITSGDKGNLHANLLAKPYSVGTARAQAGQMMTLLPLLKIATKSEKGKLIANPDSLILMKVKAELGLA